MNWPWMKIPPRSYREHARLSASNSLADYDGSGQLAELTSAKRVEAFLIDDIE